MQWTLQRAAPFTGIEDWEVTDTGARWSAMLAPDDPVFAGHYPGQPILPGIYTFEALSQGVERLLAERGLRGQVRRVKSMRFLLPFGPGHRVRVEAEVGDLRDGSVGVAAVLYRGSERAGTARLVASAEVSHA